MSDSVPTFIPKKRKQGLRTKRAQDDDSEDAKDDGEPGVCLEELLEIQKSRKRPHGINVEDLASAGGTGKEHSPARDPELNKLQTGGMVSLRTAKAMAALPSLHSGGQHIDIGTEFSAETQRRDEDYDMMKFIEEQVTKRKLTSTSINPEEYSDEKLIIKKPEDALLVVADKYKRDTGKKSEEMLSHQMLSGIPEVDLGIEAKIKNIEATEEAKRKLMRKYREEKDLPSTGSSNDSTGTSAINYVQHMRYNMDTYQEANVQPDELPASVTKSGSQSDFSATVKRDTPLLPSAQDLTGNAQPSDKAYFDRYKKNFLEKMEKEQKFKKK